MNKTVPAVSDEMVERVAKAIYDVRREWLCLDDRWSEHDDLMKENYYDMARAALAAQGQEPVAHSATRRGAIDLSEMKRALEEGRVFADADPEAQFIYDAENSCPHCGGSGHKDDIRSALTAPAQPVGVPEGGVE